MTRTFVELPLFRSKWKSLGLNDDDLKRLQEEMLLDPKTGAVMKETGGVRKMRFAFDRYYDAENERLCISGKRSCHR